MQNYSLPIITITCVFALISTGSCKKNIGAPNVQGFVIGGNDIIDANASTIDQYRIPNSEIRATGSISSVDGGKVHFCTGFVIAPANADSNPRIIANYHCFTANGKNEGEFASWACSNTKIFLGLVKDDPTLLTVGDCKANSLRGNAKADIAVFELAAPLPPEVKPFELETSPMKTSNRAHIIHHPFTQQSVVVPPIQNRKATTAKVTSTSCATTFPMKDRRKRPETGFLFDQSHSCDIIDGSSGAPVIDSESGKVIAVNWGGISWSKDGTQSENRATDAAWVAAFLENQTSSYESNVEESFNTFYATTNNANGNSSEDATAEKATTTQSKKIGGCSL